MFKLVIARTAGLLLVLLGAVTVTGWLTHTPALLQLAPGQVAMVFGSGVAFLMSGIALLVPGKQRAGNALVAIIGSTILLICGIEFAQILTSHFPGILDWPALHLWLEDGNPSPGRLAPNTSIGFMLVGALLVELARRAHGSRHTLFPLLWIALLVVSLTGFVGYWISTDFVLPVVHVKMSLVAALGFFAFLAGSRTAWNQLPGTRVHTAEVRIVRGAAIILTSLVLVAGLAGFGVLQAQAEKLVAASLEQGMQSRKQITEQSLEHARLVSHALAARLAIRSSVPASGTHDAFVDPAALQRQLEQAVDEGFRSVWIARPSGEVVASAGQRVASSAISVPLDAAGGAFLLWEGALVLRTVIALEDGHRLFMERSLKRPSALLMDVAGYGQTGEAILCAADGADFMKCFPQMRNPQPYRVSRLDKLGRTLPSARALLGQAGLAKGLDYRGHQTMAAFTHAGEGHLAMVLKQDTAEIFGDIRKRLAWFIPALIALVGAGLLLLRSQVRPLARQLARSEQTTRTTLHSIGDGVITTDPQSRITYLNPVAEHLTGWRCDEAAGRPVEEVFHIVHGSSDTRAPNPVEFILTTGSKGGLAADTVLVARDGTRTPIEDSASPIRDADQSILGVVIVLRDVAAARALAGQLSHQASHDALTDLINRREFERQLLEVLAAADPQAKGHVLLYIDLDQFKIVNDTCGHVAGDQLLKQISEVFHQKLRNSDSLARLGGDEFAVILRECPVEAGVRVAESLRSAVENLDFSWEDKSFAVGASIGAVHFSAGESPSKLLSDADSACYLAKDRGRNQVYLLESGDAAALVRSGEFQWTSRIQRALAEDRFELYAQQIVPTSQHHDVGNHYELLLRMRDDQNELVPPMAFIPAAERYGLMPSVDRWVVKSAFRHMANARAAGFTDLMFSINLSGLTMGDARFECFLEEQLERFDIPPAQICFEITESAAISDLGQAVHFIKTINARGCLFSLDDFGTGMSSFAYLKTLGVDFLKIDGEFVRNMVEDKVDAAMVDAINRIGHVMGIRTIAEFVESADIRAQLDLLGVDFAQGYGIHSPIPLQEVLDRGLA